MGGAEFSEWNGQSWLTAQKVVMNVKVKGVLVEISSRKTEGVFYETQKR